MVDKGSGMHTSICTNIEVPTGCMKRAASPKWQSCILFKTSLSTPAPNNKFIELVFPFLMGLYQRFRSAGYSIEHWMEYHFICQDRCPAGILVI